MIVTVDEKEVTRIPVKVADEWTEFEGTCSGTGEKVSICLKYQGDGAVDLLSIGMR